MEIYGLIVVVLLVAAGMLAFLRSWEKDRLDQEERQRALERALARHRKEYP